jgi:outer membrane receptor protein involved in Fe transport
LKSSQAEGIEVGFGFGYDLGDMGDLQFSGMINKYLTQESQSDALTPVIDCLAGYSNDCSPLSETTWTQRTTWSRDDISASLLWRHTDSISANPTFASGVYSGFRTIDSYNYLDLNIGYSVWDDRIRLSLTVDNITDEKPPIVGNEAGGYRLEPR